MWGQWPQVQSGPESWPLPPGDSRWSPWSPLHFSWKRAPPETAFHPPSFPAPPKYPSKTTGPRRGSERRPRSSGRWFRSRFQAPDGFLGRSPSPSHVGDAKPNARPWWRLGPPRAATAAALLSLLFLFPAFLVPTLKCSGCYGNGGVLGAPLKFPTRRRDVRNKADGPAPQAGAVLAASTVR